MGDLISSTQIVADVVKKAGGLVDSTLIANRLGLSRGAAGKCLSRAFKAGLIERVKPGFYKAKESK